MQFLSNNKEIETAISSLLKSCKSTRWAVAWATTNAPVFKLLQSSHAKISQLTVGTHFYQTDPEFISSFIKHPNAQFVLNPSGVFHPKIYYFTRGHNQWDCIVGSPNLTLSALSINSEAAVWISHEDATREFHKKILSTLDSYSKIGKRLGMQDLEAYREIWSRQQRRLGPLSGTYASGEIKSTPRRSPLDVTIFKETWKQYIQTVKEADEQNTHGRLAVLEESSRLFHQHSAFSNIDHNSRRGIAGFRKTKELDWSWFGSMKGAGYFKKAIIENNPRISKALDHIPLKGEVSAANYYAFAELFASAFEKSGIATATRLLAFKRPDYFVCLDSKNRSQLCKAFGIQQNVNLKDYWTKVIERITDSNWWNASEPSGGIERRIWRCRAAFLDVRFYVPS